MYVCVLVRKVTCSQKTEELSINFEVQVCTYVCSEDCCVEQAPCFMCVFWGGTAAVCGAKLYGPRSYIPFWITEGIVTRFCSHPLCRPGSASPLFFSLLGYDTIEASGVIDVSSYLVRNATCTMIYFSFLVPLFLSFFL